MMRFQGRGHGALLAALHGRCFPPGECWNAAAMESLLGMPGCIALVAHAPDEVPEGLAMLRVAADEAELLTLGVVPERRRAGVGRRLLDEVRHVGREAGAHRLFLEVSVANQAAASLYETAGFAETGRRRRYYPDGSDALVLVSALEPAA